MTTILFNERSLNRMQILLVSKLFIDVSCIFHVVRWIYFAWRKNDYIFWFLWWASKFRDYLLVSIFWVSCAIWYFATKYANISAEIFTEGIFNFAYNVLRYNSTFRNWEMPNKLLGMKTFVPNHGCTYKTLDAHE